MKVVCCSAVHWLLQSCCQGAVWAHPSESDKVGEETWKVVKVGSLQCDALVSLDSLPTAWAQPSESEGGAVG